MAQGGDFQLQSQPRPMRRSEQRKQKAKNASHSHEGAQRLRNMQENQLTRLIGTHNGDFIH